MSCTQIYAVTKNSCRQVAEIRNAFRGAMYVWNDMSTRYFGLKSFPMFDPVMMNRIWNAQNEHEITDFEQVVLLSTMDRVVVNSADRGRLTDAFDRYAAAHPNSSLGEQSEAIKAFEFSDGELISWCQTSVGDFQFAPEYNEETDDYKYSDLPDAWDLFKQLDSEAK